MLKDYQKMLTLVHFISSFKLIKVKEPNEKVSHQAGRG